MSTRLNFRVDPVVEERLRAAAAFEHKTVTEFVMGAAADRAEEVLAAQTVVPSEYFDQLLAALDAPDEPMPELERLAARPRRFTRR
jgi:uncharacterized protein (DUF1778 family)